MADLFDAALKKWLQEPVPLMVAKVIKTAGTPLLVLGCVGVGWSFRACLGSWADVVRLELLGLLCAAALVLWWVQLRIYASFRAEALKRWEGASHHVSTLSANNKDEAATEHIREARVKLDALKTILDGV